MTQIENVMASRTVAENDLRKIIDDEQTFQVQVVVGSRTGSGTQSVMHGMRCHTDVSGPMSGKATDGATSPPKVI